MAAPLFLLGRAVISATPMMAKALSKIGAKKISNPTKAQLEKSKKPLSDKLKKDILDKSRKKEAKEIVDRSIRKNKKPLEAKETIKNNSNTTKSRSERGKLAYAKDKLKKDNPKEYDRLYGKDDYKKLMQEKEMKESFRKTTFPGDRKGKAKTEKLFKDNKKYKYYGMRDGGFTGQKPQKLVGNQTKLDANKDGKISSIDFKMLKKQKGVS